MAKAADKQKKRKREEAPEADDDAITRSLAAYGERFMQMFEDADEHAARQQARPSKIPSFEEDGSSSSDAASDNGSDEEGSSASDASGSSGHGGVAEFVFDSKGVLPKHHLERQQQQQEQQRRRQQLGTNAKQKKLGGAGTPAPAPQLEEALKLERRAFMSSKAARVHTGAAAAAGGGSGGKAAKPSEEPGGLSREEFKQMQREVELYGAQALDKRSRKRFEAAMLSKLGAKAAKGPRINARIGLGMAKKAAQREARALEEAIDAGMVKRKGLGKKKREEKRKSLDRGLMEDRGSFRAGVMRVKLKPGGGGGSGGKKKGR